MQKILNGFTGIRLNKLTIYNDKVFGEKFSVELSDVQDLFQSNGNPEYPYTSVIIGSNGTGKSYLLKLITDILLQIDSLFNGHHKNYCSTYFEFSYFNMNDFFEIRNFSIDFQNKPVFKRKKEYWVALNNNEFVRDNVKGIFPADSILAVSVLITDRFTIHKNGPNSYKYLGIRNLNSPSSAGTRSYVKRTVEHIVNTMTEFNHEFKNQLNELLDFLNFERTLKIRYTPKYKDHFFTGELTNIQFETLFENYLDPLIGFSKRKKSERIPNNIMYYRKNFQKRNGQIQEIVSFLNELRLSHMQNRNYSKTEFFEFDIIQNELSLDKFELIKHLQGLDLISFPTIDVIKKNVENNQINLEETSSGEYHFLSSMIGMLASIEHNSIVLIDEPEISLHPNWQMKYIDFLKKIFKDYFTSHFIITSHSHFIISDLEGSTSNVLGLTNKNGKVENVELPKSLNTYGWSAEEVLYSVFDVRSSRNSFFEFDLSNMISMINSNSTDYTKIRKLLNKFLTIKISDKDPLEIIIEKTNKYLIENNA